MKRLRKILSAEDIDMSKYEQMGFDHFQMWEISYGLEQGLDVSMYADPKFDAGQMCQIRNGLEDGLDVSLYADPKFDSEQMYQIVIGLEDGLDVSEYADPRFDVEQMYEIRRKLGRKKNKKKNRSNLSYKQIEVDDWTIDNYFEYLHDVYKEDVDGALSEIDTMWGDDDLPPCVSDMDCDEIQDQYLQWLDKFRT